MINQKLMCALRYDLAIVLSSPTTLGHIMIFNGVRGGSAKLIRCLFSIIYLVFEGGVAHLQVQREQGR